MLNTRVLDCVIFVCLPIASNKEIDVRIARKIDRYETNIFTFALAV